MKTQLTKRTAALCLTAALTLSVNAAALFGGKEKAQPAEGAPTAQAVEIRTYRSIPYQAQFLAADKEGEDLTYAVEEALKKAGKDRAWLQKQMQAAGFRDEREILLAVAGAGDRVTFYKNEA